MLAVITLSATEFEMGVLIALETLAFLVIRPARPAPGSIGGGASGSWSSTTSSRALALGSLPLAYAFDMLTLWQLFAVALVTGVATVFFDVAYQSYLPSLVDKSQIVEGNCQAGHQSVRRPGGRSWRCRSADQGPRRPDDVRLRRDQLRRLGLVHRSGSGIRNRCTTAALGAR
ncbi:MAG: hypothetical protein WKF47_04345 [Geodermatophilaceae bacterium]